MVHASDDSDSSSSTEETTYERIAAMRLVESSSAYRCRDYLTNCDDDSTPSSASSSSPSGASNSSNGPIDASCRTKLIEWMHSIVDFCGYDRDTVSAAASLADRYLSRRTPDARAILSTGDRNQFQLLFLTSLNVAIKTREPSDRQLDGHVLSKLSRGRYAPEEFVQCERRLLEGLGWRVNLAPTPMEFVHEFVSLLPHATVKPNVNGVEEQLLRCARRMTEVAVADCGLITTKPSDVALAAILELVTYMNHEDFTHSDKCEFLSALEEGSSGTSLMSKSICAARLFLSERMLAVHLAGAARDDRNLSPRDIDLPAPGGEKKKISIKEGALAAESSVTTTTTKEQSPVCVSRLSCRSR